MLLADYLVQSPAVFLTIVAILGLIVGSFLNVVIYRLPVMLDRAWRRESGETPPQDEEPFNLAVPRSRCRQCGHLISAWENVPIVSYALLRGRCHGCRTHISVRYPIVELLSGALSVAIAWHFGVSLETAAGLILTWTLITLAFIDIDHQLLPDVITLPLLWVGLGLSLLWPAGDVFAQPRAAIIGAIAGYGCLWLVFHAFKLATGKEGMGYGDFKLLALLGAWLGWEMLPLVVLLAAGVGATVGISMILAKRLQRETPIPFGPYLAAAGWIAMIWGHPIMNAYLATMAR
ncbi:MAG TPA: A24 family peptidase [Gammaproteobacteria bacterium]|nr:A24 family peptidase [Gammaproteobacteria bacterium]